MKDLIRILVNGNEYDVVNSPAHIFGSIFMMNLNFYPFMSVDAIKQHMQACIELVKELEIERIAKLPAAVKKTIEAMENIIEKVTKKDNLLIFITNLILAKEGLGLLPGFNCVAKSKDAKANLKMNPEKQSIVTIKP